MGCCGGSSAKTKSNSKGIGKKFIFNLRNE